MYIFKTKNLKIKKLIINKFNNNNFNLSNLNTDSEKVKKIMGKVVCNKKFF